MSLVSWPIYGCKLAAIIPLVKNESGKFALGDKTYIFNLFGKGTGIKIPKPGDSSSKDSYLSFESTQQQTVRIKLNPQTITISGDTATVESGSGDSTATYPEITLLIGDLPTVKTGTADPVKATYKEFFDMQVALQTTPAAVILHMGDTSDGSIGCSYAVAKLTSDIENKPDSKSYEGTTLTFTGASESLDATIAIPVITAKPFQSKIDFTLPALAAASAKTLESGKLIIV